MSAPHGVSTPINTINRENLRVLLMNNVLNNSIEFMSDSDTMEMDSPVRKPCIHLISKKLFHSPMMSDADNLADPTEVAFTKTNTKQARRAKKRKQKLVPDSDENDIKRAYVSEYDKDGYNPEVLGGMRRKVLISIFHNKEYSMDCVDTSM